MSAPLSFARQQVLASIVQQVTQRVNEFFAAAAAQPSPSLAALEATAARLTQDCLLPAVALVVEEQRQQVETDPAVARCGCGQSAHYKGPAPRTLVTQAGPLTFRRAYYYCKGCQQGFYPLDVALGLGPGQFSEGVQAGVCRLGAELPFERAAATYTALTGVPISPREAARLTEARGAAWEEELAEERAALLAGTAPPAPPPCRADGGRWVVALDAAKACFRDGWHEIKVGVVGRAQPTLRPGHEPGSWRPGAQVGEQSYVAHVGSMSGAAERLYAEVVRRGCDPGAETVLCLGDGAPSIWNEYATHFPHRVEVLDWYHAVEHLWAAGNGLFGEGTAAAAAWVAARKEELWDGDVAAVVAALQTAATQESRGRAAAEEVHYFTVNAGRMAYATYRAAGYPLGSGVVESGCKQVVGQRAKGAGMRWSGAGVQGVLTLRATLLSGGWEVLWATRRKRPTQHALAPLGTVATSGQGPAAVAQPGRAPMLAKAA
jgi:hypothetical protein